MGTFPRLSNFSLFITYTFEAARNTLIQRGDPSTGWSMGWKVCFWARCLDGNHAFKLIANQLILFLLKYRKVREEVLIQIYSMLIRLSRLMEILVVQPELLKC